LIVWLYPTFNLQKKFLGSVLLLILLNLLVKPLWIFGIDRAVQNMTGFSAYGQYFALMNLCMVFLFIQDPGLHINMNREVAARRSDSLDIFWDSFYGKLALTLAYTAVVVLAALASGIRDAGFILMIILLQSSISMLLFIRSFLTASQLFRQDSMLSIIDKLIVILLTGTLIFFPPLEGMLTIRYFVAIQIAGVGIALVAGMLMVFRHVDRFAFRPFTGFRKAILFSSLPYAANIFLMTVILRADAFLLERIHHNGATEAGIYAAGFRIMDAFSVMGSLVAGFLMPFIARYWPDKERFSGVVLVCRQFLVCVAIIAGVTGSMVPEFLTRLLYHRDDPGLVIVMQTILLSLPAISLVHIYGTILTATQNIATFTRVSMVFAVLSLLLNLVLIPRFGAMACTVTAVVVQSLYAAVLIIYSRTHTGLGLRFSDFTNYLLAGLICALVIRLSIFFKVSVPVSLCIAGIITAAFFYAISGVSLKRLKEIFL
jgi:O-antigen/teichoic acid export membrane protein